MGIIPTETVYGDDCLLCFGAGKTPSLMKVFLSGIERSIWWNPFWGDLPNGYLDLLQDEHNPCGWTSPVGFFPRATFHTNAVDSIIQVWSNLNKAAFVSHAGESCKWYGTNEFIGQEPLGFQGGYASVSVSGDKAGNGDNPPVNLSKVINSFTPMIDPDPRMECFPMDDELIVIRYAGKRDATNISIKFDTNP